jgi:hypothetical protein
VAVQAAVVVVDDPLTAFALVAAALVVLRVEMLNY